MQSQAITIDRFNNLLQEIQPKLQDFRDQIVETESDYVDFFKHFLNSASIEFVEQGNIVIVEPKECLPAKPFVGLKFSLTTGKTKNDDIINLLTALGISYFLKANPNAVRANIRLFIEKNTSDFDFFQATRPTDSFALAIIVDSNPLVEPDSIAFKSGALIPARHEFKIKIFPGNGVENKSDYSDDLIPVAAQAITSLAQIPTRKLDPLHLAYASFKDIETDLSTVGGAVQIAGVINALDEVAGSRMKSIMESTLDAIARSNECQFEVTFEKSEQAFRNHAEYMQFLMENGMEILGKTKVQNLEYLNKNYENCSSLFQRFPVVILHVGGLDNPNNINLIPTLQLSKIDKISQTAIKAICWSLAHF